LLPLIFIPCKSKIFYDEGLYESSPNMKTPPPQPDFSVEDEEFLASHSWKIALLIVNLQNQLQPILRYIPPPLPPFALHSENKHCLSLPELLKVNYAPKNTFANIPPPLEEASQ
ncbi:MAG: hypothetical protein EZS28_054728, partial [Streblomastix strix]